MIKTNLSKILSNSNQDHAIHLLKILIININYLKQKISNIDNINDIQAHLREVFTKTEDQKDQIEMFVLSLFIPQQPHVLTDAAAIFLLSLFALPSQRRIEKDELLQMQKDILSIVDKLMRRRSTEQVDATLQATQDTSSPITPYQCIKNTKIAIQTILDKKDTPEIIYEQSKIIRKMYAPRLALPQRMQKIKSIDAINLLIRAIHLMMSKLTLIAATIILFG